MTSRDSATDIRHPLRGAAWPLSALLLLTLVYHLPLLISPADVSLQTDDITLYLQWLHEYTRDHLLAGHVPLWNPYNYAGIPFAANPQTAVFYPLSWLYLCMPVIEAHKWLIALHGFLGGSFLYLFLRQLGISRIPAIVGSLPWMFGSYFVANAAVGHLNMLFTAAWLPLVLLFYDRAVQTNHFRWVFWTGFVLGVQLLAGEPQNTYYTILLMTVYGLVRTIYAAIPGRGRFHLARYWPWAAQLMAVGLIAALTSGIQLFLTAEMTRFSDRTANSYEFTKTMSFWPSSVLGFVAPWREEARAVIAIEPEHVTDAHGRDTMVIVDPERILNFNHEFAVYVGILTLVLAALSLQVRGRPPVRAAQILLLVAVILMLGGYTPIYRLLYAALPGLNLFRVPARAIVIAVWALCVMSASGLEWLTQPDTNRWQHRTWRSVAAITLVLVGGLLIVSVVLVELRPYAVRDETVDKMPLTLTHAWVWKPIACIVVSTMVLIALRWASRTMALGLIAILIAGDLMMAKPTFPLAPYSRDTDRSLTTLEGIRNQMDRSQEPSRTDLPPSLVVANAALGARVENMNGYWPIALGRFYRFVHAMRNHSPDPGSRHQLHDDLYMNNDFFPLRIMNVRFAAGLDTQRGMTTLVEKTDFTPRSWVVEQAEVLTTDSEILGRLKDPNFDPARTVVLESAPTILLQPTRLAPGRATTRRIDEGNLEILTDTTRPGYLVLSEVFYPGWQAQIDGRPVPSQRANYLLTALPLPAGSHRVTYAYEPLSFKLGAGCTLVACLAAIGVLARRWRQPRAAASSSPPQHV